MGDATTNESGTIIDVRDVSVSYGANPVLEHVSFKVGRGRVLVIIGGSGSGKSTLLKVMIGLHKPDNGRAIVNGRDIVTAEGDERNEILKSFGVMYQSGALFGSMTLLENVRLPLEEFTELPEDAMNLIALMKLRLVGLDDAAAKMPSELSGGMRKRAGIARAMALDPQILFLDEPSAGLDPITSSELDELILSLVRSFGMTFVVISHELESIKAIANNVLMINKETKGIVAMGTPEELATRSDDPWVRRFFARGFAGAERNAR